MKRDLVTLFTAEPVQLLFVVTDPDEREPDKYVLSTFIDQHRIARLAVDLEFADEIRQLASEPRALMYCGWEGDPGIQAQLFALSPDQSEAWKTAQNMEAHYLGTVIRASEFRVFPTDLYKECNDHFQAILNGKTVEPIEQIMKRLA